jgi:predicted nucleic acid-binding protein
VLSKKAAKASELLRARLQNDLLLALTARHTRSLFVTGDAHFTALRRHVSFRVKVLPSP